MGEQDTLLNNVGKQRASVQEVSRPTKAKARVTFPEKLPKDEERYDCITLQLCAHLVHATAQAKANKEVATQDPYGN